MLELNHQPHLEAVQEQKKKSILIVDDEAIIRDLCSRALKSYQTFEAANGDEALRIFAQGGIDVILTDVMMPNMNGIELLKRLKELEPTLVVIVMTGFAEKDVILNALKADADDFIAKPLNLLQLKTAVDKALVKKALKEEVANLRSLDRFKTNFLSTVSHKFRTPITTISLFLQNLASGVCDPTDPTYRENIHLILDEASYLEHLVADLLTFSRVMDTGRAMSLAPCDLKSLVMQVLSESKEVLRRPGIELILTLGEIPPLSLDREKITFAIRQVIDNAFKFSHDTGTVTVSLKEEAGAVVLQVVDAGIGIAKEDLPKIFEKFYQVDASHTGQIRGFGLGLYYAKEFLRQHGATISVESEEGKGTSVTLSFPVTA